MRSVIYSAVALVFLSSVNMASAGCVGGAVAGGVAGHMAGHGKVGAAVGCAVGHHMAKKKNG